MDYITLFYVICAYFIGSISSSDFVAKVIYKKDLKKSGSGNLGATNTTRVLGKKAGILVLVFDLIVKGVLPIIIINIFKLEINEVVAGFFVMLGHTFPFYLKFKGGKGVATGAGICLAINPTLFLVLVCLFIAIVKVTKYVSLASILIAITLLFIQGSFYLINKNYVSFSAIFLMSSLVVVNHYSNIQRLLNHTENKFTLKKDKN